MPNKSNFQSQGKLLISGEYVVLDGAKALAIPTIQGQQMNVEEQPSRESLISWESYDDDKKFWFHTQLNYKELTISHPTAESETLLKVFSTQQVQNALKNKNTHFKIQTHLDFPRNWGLGTSSTFVNNLALWLQIDPYTLQFEIFGGSGYDIACANSQHPLIYQLQDKQPQSHAAVLHPDIIPYLYFIYLGNKQNSRDAIQKYRRKKPTQKQIATISWITEELVKAQIIDQFDSLIREHNTILSEILQQPSAQEIFPDAPFTLKNLGAWGGDFIMAIGDESVIPFFKNKNFSTVLRYKELFY